MPDPGVRQLDAPTRARFGVIYFGIALAVIQYIDRVCISWAMPDIRTSLGIAGPEHDHAVGYVFSAFTLAYALFEIPTGWLGDRFGPRKTLVRVVLWWSLFTAATGWVFGLSPSFLHEELHVHVTQPVVSGWISWTRTKERF